MDHCTEQPGTILCRDNCTWRHSNVHGDDRIGSMLNILYFYNFLVQIRTCQYYFGRKAWSPVTSESALGSHGHRRGHHGDDYLSTWTYPYIYSFYYTSDNGFVYLYKKKEIVHHYCSWYWLLTDLNMAISRLTSRTLVSIMYMASSNGTSQVTSGHRGGPPFMLHNVSFVVHESSIWPPGKENLRVR